MLEDLCWSPKPKLHVEGSAAKAVSGRVGLGKARHIDVMYIWVQQAVRRRRIDIRKIRGDRNRADVLTKRAR